MKPNCIFLKQTKIRKRSDFVLCSWSFFDIWLNRRQLDSQISSAFSLLQCHTSCSLWKTHKKLGV